MVCRMNLRQEAKGKKTALLFSEQRDEVLIYDIWVAIGIKEIR